MNTEVRRGRIEAPRRIWLARYVSRLLSLIERGRLTVLLPSGEAISSSSPVAGPDAVVMLKSWRPVRRLFLGGDTAFAQSYAEGEWDTPDLGAVIDLAIANRQAIYGATTGSWLVRQAQRVAHFLRRNSRAGSRRNIAFHYDLGNGFYRQWLDERMIYSSALYDEAGLTLEQAQSRKLSLVADALNAGPSDRVLEIGCGWGALALHIARMGAHVTGVTLSAEQLVHAEEEARRSGLENRVEFRFQDYRDVAGQFDRVVSIEMLEAVGEAYWPTYFHTLADRLAPGGVAVVQAITIDAAVYPAYRATPDFIQQSVFPGGMLPTVEIMRTVSASCGLSMSCVRQFGQSYALTLAEWRRRFRARSAELARLGFDTAFQRMWEYYLVYCEAGFRAGQIDVGVYTFTKDRGEG